MSSGKEDLWVFISDPLHVDMKCFQFWLNGHPVSKTSQYLIDTYSKQQAFQGVDPDDIGREANDQYRTFHLLEPYLASPLSFEKHNFFHVDPSVVSELIERYFDFDSGFMREMVGRRLSNKLRDHMDDISERTRLEEGSCLRQFDNLRRVYKKVISLNHVHPSSLPVAQMLQTNFRISSKLARRYVRVIFLVYHRFEVKKKLQFMTFADFEFLAETLLPRWTAQHVRGQTADSELDQIFSIHLHPKLISKLRDLKTLMSSTHNLVNDYATLVRQKLGKTWEDQKKLKEVEHRIYSFLKLLLNTGAALSQPKQFRDFLSNAVEFIAEPCKRIELTYTEMEDVLTEIETCFHTIAESFTQMPDRHRQQLQDSWLRYAEGMRLLILHVYDRVGE
eukprot:TRINITY_DN1095_c0_g1_i1.p1 TRINITY_DN1095_c0_g1~~TRINITY_DN1095_c0_g1_i1.p1  ORF type:complete len:391 (-),score=37.90 TRINITY_DN1095_c0_g1_i1:29-1201(-)